MGRRSAPALPPLPDVEQPPPPPVAASPPRRPSSRSPDYRKRERTRRTRRRSSSSTSSTSRIVKKGRAVENLKRMSAEEYRKQQYEYELWQPDTLNESSARQLVHNQAKERQWHIERTHEKEQARLKLIQKQKEKEEKEERKRREKKERKRKERHSRETDSEEPAKRRNAVDNMAVRTNNELRAMIKEAKAKEITIIEDETQPKKQRHIMVLDDGEQLDGGAPAEIISLE